MSRRSLFSTVACLLLGALAANASPDDTRILTPPDYTTFLPPGAGRSYRDPVFRTNITRITDATHTTDFANSVRNLTWIENEYSTASPFNNDNSRLILVHESYFGLYDGKGKALGNLPLEMNASSEPRWSRRNNSTLYYRRGNQLKSYNVSTAATNVVHTFGHYSSISGKGQMDISLDGDHFVLVGDSRYVFVYTLSTDTEGRVFDTGGSFGVVSITPDNSVTISWLQAGLGLRNGIELFDGDMNFVRQLTHAGGHMHMGVDVGGESVLIWTNSADPQPIPNCNNGIVKVRIGDGTQTCLLALDWSLAVHISAADNTWAFAETYNPSDVIPPAGWFPYTNELLQIKLDGSEIRRLAHHRSRPLDSTVPPFYDSYVYQPKVTASRDGALIVYGSNFGLQVILGYPHPYADTYLIATGISVPTGLQQPVNTTPPLITGAAQQGQTLTASTGVWSGNPTAYGYQWLRCNRGGSNCAGIRGAASATYLLVPDDSGKTLRVAVTVSNSAGSATAASVPTSVVTSGPL